MGDERSKAGTAGELMAELETDPEYQDRTRRDDAQRAKRTAALREAEQPLAQGLRRLGYDVDTAWDLHRHRPYDDALPLLVEHLSRDYPDRVREGIARALAVREAGRYWEQLLTLYEEEPPNTDAKQGLTVAVGTAAKSADHATLISLARDRSHGPDRVLLIPDIIRTNRRGWVQELEDLSADPELTAECRHRLHKRELREARQSSTRG